MGVDRPSKKLLEQLSGQLDADGRLADDGVLISINGPAPRMWRAEDLVLGGEAAGVPLRVLTPTARPRAVIVYYHGLGPSWATGSMGEYETLVRKLAERMNCTFVMVDWRRPPASPHPTPTDDAYAALELARDQLIGTAEYEMPLMVAGDGVGGNLATEVAMRARDSGGPAVSMQILIYPMTDADLGRASYRAEENQVLLKSSTVAEFWKEYEPDSERRLDPDLSPLRSENLKGLPPAVVLTAECDPLRDEGEAYARRLLEAGGLASYRCYAGQLHGFFNFLQLPQGEAAMQQVVKAVALYLARGPEAVLRGDFQALRGA